MQARMRKRDVFINCPFDDVYKPIFEGIVFTVYSIGFVARCALEVDDASEARLSKIVRIIEQCSFGIHDISSVGLGANTSLPRFNMPLELGLYLGCKFFGTTAQRRKGCLVLDSEPYRYAQFTRDLPRICEELKRQPKDMTFADFSETVEIWLKSAR
jgi:hypothetical protein